MRNILVVYYSFSGNTRGLAESIAEAAHGTLRELIPEQAYTFDYNAAAKEARSQTARGHCPKLRAGDGPIDAYDTVFIGTPNWFGSIAPPVRTFLRHHSFAGKTVIPFCTHGGGGFGLAEGEIGAECAGTALLPGMAVEGGGSPEEVAEWLGRIGIL